MLKLVCSKDLTQAIPDQTLCLINPDAIAWVEIRDDWKWKPQSPHIGESVAIIRFLVTRGDICRDRDLNRFSAHVLYVIGRERIDQLVSYMEDC